MNSERNCKGMKNNKVYRVVGLMSGTSLDGLDITLCHFIQSEQKWQFELVKGHTVSYCESLKLKLQKSTKLTGLELTELDFELGQFFGECVNKEFGMDEFDFIASHGHTVFHQPSKGITLQIGNHKALYAGTQKPVISDFRTQDVLLGGHGAPLVPIADRDLFGDFDYCINLGGIANISFESDKIRRAHDIGPCNMILNYLANKLGSEFDKEGEVARGGLINTDLLSQWNSYSYFEDELPKSLGYEWVAENYFPDLDNVTLNISDLMATCVEHCAMQVARSVVFQKDSSILFTGGGAHNTYLIERIEYHLPQQSKVIIPNADIVNFKEAISFAYLGLLRLTKTVNVLSSVTGAKQDSCSGQMFGF